MAKSSTYMKRYRSAKSGKSGSKIKKSGSTKAPSVGAKVQSAYINYVKKQVNVDLSKARDTEFDNRNGFNIDTRKLGRNDLNAVKNLARKKYGSFDVRFEDNGAYRVYIRVKSKEAANQNKPKETKKKSSSKKKSSGKKGNKEKSKKKSKKNSDYQQMTFF